MDNMYWFSSSEKEKVDNFEVGEVIGSGATSIVYVVQHKETKKKFAMKQIKRDIDTEIIYKEISILLKLDHPNIIKLEGIFQSEQNVSLILELVTGGKLFDRIVNRGFYSEHCAAHCIKQILEGVKYLHANAVVHRDIKPENLLYATKCDDSDLKIADFGLSEIVPDGGCMYAACGTLGYCAPEVLMGQEYGCAVDLWSVGVILYNMLSGLEPFGSKQIQQMIAQKTLKCDISYPSPWWDKISENAIDLVNKLIVYNPEKRLTAELALQHPWVQGKGANTIQMEETQNKLREFNARRKMKGCIDAVVVATNLMKTLNTK